MTKAEKRIELQDQGLTFTVAYGTAILWPPPLADMSSWSNCVVCMEFERAAGLSGAADLVPNLRHCM